MVFFKYGQLRTTSRGNHGNHCLLSMNFLHLLLVVTTIPTFKFLAYPILEILPSPGFQVSSISHSGDITEPWGRGWVYKRCSYYFNPLSAGCGVDYTWKHSESETISGWNWKVIRCSEPEGEARADIKSHSLWTADIEIRVLMSPLKFLNKRRNFGGNFLMKKVTQK